MSHALHGERLPDLAQKNQTLHTLKCHEHALRVVIACSCDVFCVCLFHCFDAGALCLPNTTHESGIQWNALLGSFTLCHPVPPCVCVKAKQCPLQNVHLLREVEIEALSAMAYCAGFTRRLHNALPETRWSKAQAMPKDAKKARTSRSTRLESTREDTQKGS